MSSHPLGSSDALCRNGLDEPPGSFHGHLRPWSSTLNFWNCEDDPVNVFDRMIQDGFRWFRRVFSDDLKKCSVFDTMCFPPFFSKTPMHHHSCNQKTHRFLGHWRSWRLLGWHIAWTPSRPEACFGLEAIYEPHLDWILRQVERILLAKQYKQDDKFSGFSAMISGRFQQWLLCSIWAVTLQWGFQDQRGIL